MSKVDSGSRHSSKNGVRSDLTVTRGRKTVENKEYAAMAKRIVKAFSKRVAAGDVEALSDLLALSKDLNAAIGDAVTGLREFGYSWSEIASRVGVTKQTAQERWGTAHSKLPKQIRRSLAQDALPGLVLDGDR
jgi:hypothetical protein